MPRHRLAGRALVPAAALAFAFAFAAPSAADSETTADPRGDTVRIDTGIPGNPSIDNDQIDVVGLRVGHGNNLRAVVDVVRLRGSGWFLDVLVRAPSGENYVMGYSALSGDTRTYVYAIGERGSASEPLRRRGCGGVVTDFDRTRDRWVLIAARSCFGDPRWVRVGVLTGRRINDTAFRLDDARRDGNARLGSANAKLGPRIDAGPA